MANYFNRLFTRRAGQGDPSATWDEHTKANPENQTKVLDAIEGLDDALNLLLLNIDNGILKNSDGTYGGKITVNSGLVGTVSTFKALIGGKVHELTDAQDITFDATRAALVYATKQAIAGNIVPTIGKVNADYPAVNGSCVLRYTFSETEGNPTDTSATGNNIETMSNCTLVDSRIGKARQGNGTSGYMSTALTTGISGSNARTERIGFTPHTLSGGSTIRYIKKIGNYGLYTEGARLKIIEQSNVYNTGFDLEADVDYLIGIVYNETKLKVFISGGLYRGVVYSTNATFNSTTGTGYFLRNSTAANYNDGTIWYYDLWNEALSLESIGDAANKTLLLNHYLSNPKNILPTNSAVLGLVKTDATDIVEIIDTYQCLLRHDITFNNDFPGVSKDFSGIYEPYGYFFKFGQEFSRAIYPNLFAVIGTTYGAGDGIVTANLPDARGRVTIGLDNMGGLSANNVVNENADTLGGSGGEERHALTSAENGAHTHLTNIYTSGGSVSANIAGPSAVGNVNITTSSSGSGEAHNTMQPWIAVNKIIKW
jgi:microcystin-dependent protein